MSFLAVSIGLSLLQAVHLMVSVSPRQFSWCLLLQGCLVSICFFLYARIVLECFLELGLLRVILSSLAVFTVCSWGGRNLVNLLSFRDYLFTSCLNEFLCRMKYFKVRGNCHAKPPLVGLAYMPAHTQLLDIS